MKMNRKRDKVTNQEIESNFNDYIAFIFLYSRGQEGDTFNNIMRKLELNKHPTQRVLDSLKRRNFIELDYGVYRFSFKAFYSRIDLLTIQNDREEWQKFFDSLPYPIVFELSPQLEQRGKIPVKKIIESCFERIILNV